MNALYSSLYNRPVLRRIIVDKRILLGVRTLFSDQYLSIDKYVDARDITQKQYGSMKANFMTRMKQQLASEKNLVFTEDLKTVVHLVEDTDEDLRFCTQMIKKFHGQNKELRFGTFVFGPVIMRLMHHLRKTDLALELITDESVSEFFDQVRSYLIAMDLMYENGRYQEVLDLNEKLKSKNLAETKYPRDCLVLAAAACYKLNTPESYAYAINMVTDARQCGAVLSQKAIYFISSLALNQLLECPPDGGNQVDVSPHESVVYHSSSTQDIDGKEDLGYRHLLSIQNKADVSMELLSSLQMNNNPLGNNLKLMTLAKLDRLQDAFSILRRKVEHDVPVQSLVRGDIMQCTLDVLKEAVDRAQDTELTHEFDHLSKLLLECNAVSPQTIDGLLSEPIIPRLVPPADRFGGQDRRDQPFFRRENRPRVRQAYGGGAMMSHE